MNERTKRTLIRFAKVAAAAVLPVAIAAAHSYLSGQPFDLHAFEVGAGTALLAALEKYATFTPEPA